MLQIWNFFLSGISYEGLHLVVYWIFRNFEQMVLIYLLVYGVTRLVAAILRPAAPATALPTLQQG
jgi:prolipoprotein diacylglyceryltransferase